MKTHRRTNGAIALAWLFLATMAAGCDAILGIDGFVGGCSNGQTRCVGNTIELCDGTYTWRKWECGNRTCVEDPITNSATCKGDCAPGRRCMGNTPQQCNAQGQWEGSTPCGSNEVCNGGSCTCINGDLRCYDNMPHECVGAVLVPFAASCTDTHQTCDEQTANCIGDCAPREKKCKDDTMVQGCNVLGQWVDETTCEGSCVDGACTLCITGQQRCIDNIVETCDGTDTWVKTVCSNQTCFEGPLELHHAECVGNCAPGKRCVGNTPQHCNYAGEWLDDPLCQVNEYCQGGECVLECVPGDLRCFDNTPQHCGEMKRWQDTEAKCAQSTCDSATVKCVGDCAPDELQCNASGSNVQACSSAGIWYDVEVCPLGCVDSACLGTCDDNEKNGLETDIDCGGMECPPCPYFRMCSLDSDCLGAICLNGVCQPGCQDGVKNLNETDIDCGGGQCIGCNPGQGCYVGLDCAEKVCGPNGTCSAPNCTDFTTNGQETDVDCGGPDCVTRCATGQACFSPTDCTNKVCANGSCAPALCTDQVQNGTETDIDCGGPSCPACEIGKTCINGSDCQSFICAAGRCTPKPPGLPCTTGSLCLSTFCVDGVCCNEACTDTCKACTAAKKGNGQDGVCGMIVSGFDPDDECATDQPTTCGKTGFCNGAGSCQTYSHVVECAQATCKDAVTLRLPRYCNGNGACLTSMEQSCVPYTCQAGTCLTTCNLDAQCADGYYCGNNVCIPKKVDGNACIFSNECLNANCVDGVCCDSNCTGECQACSAAKKLGGVDGVCGPIANNADPDSECAATMAPTCGPSGVCNGAGACALWPNGTLCSSPTCVNSTTLSPSSTCNGTGTCTAAMQISCVPYLCQGSACSTSCMNDTSCSLGNYCLMSTCVPKKTNGATCTAGNECTTGNCVDGVCCNSACTGACQACSAAKKGGGIDGDCGPIANNLDPDDECAGTATCNGLGACQP